ncbi:hypothetical protein [Mucilaginibacter sp.]
MAQKLPGVQNGNLWAPQGVKIDGKINEWGESLKAYNKNVLLWYNIANDDKNIYLAIKSTDLDNNNKILAGGVSFTINTEGKKKTKNAYTITFPVISRTGIKSGRSGKRGGFGQDDTPDTTAIVAQQKQLLATSKMISAIGFTEITDTLVSIYNEYGIKAAASIDAKDVFTLEIAIPIELLKIAADNKNELAYNIKLNGLQLPSVNIGSGVKISGNNGGSFGNGGGFSGGFGRSSSISDLMSPTDFWGMYILASKAASQ